MVLMLIRVSRIVRGPPSLNRPRRIILKLERGMRDPGKAFREMSRDNVFVSAHIVDMLVYVYFNTGDDDDDVKTE